MTVKEVAERLGISVRTVYSFMERGKIPYYKIGHSVRFDEQEIEAWLEKRKMNAKEEVS